MLTLILILNLDLILNLAIIRIVHVMQGMLSEAEPSQNHRFEDGTNRDEAAGSGISGSHVEYNVGRNVALEADPHSWQNVGSISSNNAMSKEQASQWEQFLKFQQWQKEQVEDREHELKPPPHARRKSEMVYW